MKKFGIMMLLLVCITMIVIGLYIGYNEQYTIKKLTEEEKAEVIRIALNDPEVKEQIGNKVYEIGDVDLCGFERIYKEERISGTYPCLHIYLDGKEEVGVTLVVSVDLKEGMVTDIGREYRRGMPPPFPKLMT